MGQGWRRVICAGVRVATILVVIAVLPQSSAQAGSIPYPQTDIMFVFDTSGSMEEALAEAKSEIHDAMGQIGANLPDVQFGLSEVKDYGGSEYDEENENDLPWNLNVPITSDQAAVADSLSALEAFGGGDSPESYARALWETALNPRIGWRPGSRHLIVLIADNVPHDEELNEGIPETDWFEESPWSTGVEIQDAAEVPGSVLTPTTNLDWQSVLQQLATEAKPLEFVDYQGQTGLLPYWENWAARTGGRAVFADAGELVTQLVGLAATGGTAAACASVSGSVGKRLLASLRCAGAKTWLDVKCGVELSIGKALKALSTAKGVLKISKVRKGWRPLARLVNHIKQAKFSDKAPKGFRSWHEVIDKLSKADTVWDLAKVLRGVAKAVSPQDFRRIALDIGDVAGARACVQALLSAVE